MIQVGPYLLEREVGRGGMGSVWLARHRELGVVRAVKLLQATTPERAARFEREVALLARVRHPQVVAIHEAGLQGAQPWYAMDLVEGETLDRVLARGPLPWDEAAALVREAARGVAALHAQGIVHRDLKPANLARTAPGQAVVLDLGAAAAPEMEERLTRTGVLIGTPSHMAPEQLEGAAATPPSDVYALGVILWELVTGEPALPGASSLLEVMARVAQRGPLRPGARGVELPAALDDLVAACTEGDPARRPRDAGALLAALEAILAAPGESARARRTRQRLLLALALLVAGATGAAALLALPGPPPPREAEADVPAPPPAPERPGPAPLAEENPAEGARELRRIEEEPAPLRRWERLGEWLTRHGGHREAARARAQRRQARLAAPLATGELGDGSAWLAWDVAGQLGLAGQDRQELWGADGVRLRGLPFEGGPLAAHPAGGLVGAARELEWCASEGEAPRRWPYAGTPRGLLGRLISAGRRAVAVSPDGRLAAVARGLQVLLQPLDGPPEAQQILDLGLRAEQVSFSPDGKLLAAVGYDLDAARAQPGQGLLRVWRLPALEPLLERFYPSHSLSCLAFLPDAQGLLVGTTLGELWRLDPSTGERQAVLRGQGLVQLPDGLTGDEFIRAHEQGVRRVVVTRDGRRCASIAGGNQPQPAGDVRWWDLVRGEELTPPLELGAFLEDVALSPDGRRLAIASDRGRVWLFPALDGVDAAGEVLASPAR